MFAKANDPDVLQLVERISDLDSAKDVHFNTFDDRGIRLDCINIFQPIDSDQLFGLYHEDITPGTFNIHLATTNTLEKWTHVTKLDDHAS